jgi:hypothetical protein
VTKYSAEDILRTWEESWGPLPDKWKNTFLNHPSISKIIYYPDNWIEIAISKNRKLDKALEYLIKNEKEVEPHEYRPEILETDSMIDNITRSFGKQPSNPIPDNDWWRDQV